MKNATPRAFGEMWRLQGLLKEVPQLRGLPGYGAVNGPGVFKKGGEHWIHMGL